MIDLQSFNIYLKVGWIKRLFSNLDGDWQKVLLFNLQSYGGKRVLTFQIEKLKEVAMKLTNPFWKDVLSSYHFAKPYTVDSRYLEFDGTMEKIRVNRSSTQEELRRYRKRDLFNNERETTRAKF